MANDPSITLRVPEKSREFVLLVAVMTATTIALGLSALLFRELSTAPFGGYLVNHYKVVAPGAGFFAAIVTWITRWIWAQHKSFVAGLIDRLEHRLGEQNQIVMAGISDTDAKVTALDQKVDSVIKEQGHDRDARRQLEAQVQAHAIELAEIRGERRERDRMSNVAQAAASLVALPHEKQGEASS